ncbi:hypothetical protein L1987_12110 [Smallanthus sonchifolius]|uniref:Uncharacterized protein n=1 Tax=Smallanthus sonchifolius TaxID=185202 RepID=A0ACB9JF02_9ASTR|nr:hypothetical protein L1987_12110 [Smallanthus sonchifolius]
MRWRPLLRESPSPSDQATDDNMVLTFLIVRIIRRRSHSERSRQRSLHLHPHTTVPTRASTILKLHRVLCTQNHKHVTTTPPLPTYCSIQTQRRRNPGN